MLNTLVTPSQKTLNLSLGTSLGIRSSPLEFFIENATKETRTRQGTHDRKRTTTTSTVIPTKLVVRSML
uniref:Uncharacterized protein n=1 Tax=Helianthus annuus TaxID=4232 RepID=A0A251SLW3_HELAN